MAVREKNRGYNRGEMLIFIKIKHLSFSFLKFVKKMEKKMLEKNFQSKLIKELKTIFEGCIVLKSDPTYLQGIPDLIIFYKDKWATLECKQNENSHVQPNQDYYVEKMNNMSFSRFVYPENKDIVIKELKKYFY